MKRGVLLLPVLLHGAVALLARGLGVRMENHEGRDWDFFWQTLPRQALQEDLLASLWNLHAQPPGLSLIGAAVLRLAGDEHLVALQVVYVLLGAAVSGMVAWLAFEATDDRRVAWLAGGLFAVSPALLLYEAYVLYTLPTVFCVTAGAVCLAKYRRDRRERWLLAFLVVVEGLVLTRSLYHPILLIPAAALVFSLAVPPHGRRALLCLLLCLPALGWTAKNAVRFDVFSGSSWAGCNVWKAAATGVSGQELVTLASRGVLPPVVARVPVFAPPSAYRAFGFDRREGTPSLDRDDLHNGNVPAICDRYGEAARTLILRDPLRYLRNLTIAYGRFAIPSSRHAHLAPNAARLQPFESLGADVVLGHALTRRSAAFFGYDPFGSLLFLAIPLLLVVSLLRQLRNARRDGVAAWQSLLREDPALVYALFLVAYTTAVGCAFDLGENERFKFAVSPLLWWLSVREGHRWIARRARSEG